MKFKIEIELTVVEKIGHSFLFSPQEWGKS